MVDTFKPLNAAQLLFRIIEAIRHEASVIPEIAPKQSYVLKVSDEPLTYRQLRYLSLWRDGNPHADHSAYADEDTITLNKETLFGAENFKKISGIDLPEDIAGFYSAFHILGDISYPVVADFQLDDFSTSHAKRLMCPEKIAKVFTNQWDGSVDFYTKRGFYDFKRRKRLPIIEMDDGCYLEYAFAKTKPAGIYFYDEKISNNMADLVLRLCINPDFFLPSGHTDKEIYRFRDFTSQSEIPWDYLRAQYG